MGGGYRLSNYITILLFIPYAVMEKKINTEMKVFSVNVVNYLREIWSTKYSSLKILSNIC